MKLNFLFLDFEIIPKNNMEIIAAVHPENSFGTFYKRFKKINLKPFKKDVGKMSITPSELKKRKKIFRRSIKKVNEIIEEYDESIQEKIQDITESKNILGKIFLIWMKWKYLRHYMKSIKICY